MQSQYNIILMHFVFSGYESLNPYTLQNAYYQHALMGQQAGIATLERPRYSATEQILDERKGIFCTELCLLMEYLLPIFFLYRMLFTNLVSAVDVFICAYMNIKQQLYTQGKTSVLYDLDSEKQ